MAHQYLTSIIHYTNKLQSWDEGDLSEYEDELREIDNSLSSLYEAATDCINPLRLK